LSEQDCNGKEVSLETYKGKVLLVVNVASKWYHLFPPAVDRIVLFFWRCLGLEDAETVGVLDAASGFTETNYTQLTELYQKYRDKGKSFACCCS
jgi:glutathione peroxidase